MQIPCVYIPGPAPAVSVANSYRDLFRISDNRDYRDNHDYHSSKMLSDNREIAIIALAKKVAIIAISTSSKKRLSYFAKN